MARPPIRSRPSSSGTPDPRTARHASSHNLVKAVAGKGHVEQGKGVGHNDDLKRAGKHILLPKGVSSLLRGIYARLGRLSWGRPQSRLEHAPQLGQGTTLVQDLWQYGDQEGAIHTLALQRQVIRASDVPLFIFSAAKSQLEFRRAIGREHVQVETISSDESPNNGSIERFFAGAASNRSSISTSASLWVPVSSSKT